jgi:hypothetical protein
MTINWKRDVKGDYYAEGEGIEAGRFVIDKKWTITSGLRGSRSANSGYTTWIVTDQRRTAPAGRPTTFRDKQISAESRLKDAKAVVDFIIRIEAGEEFDMARLSYGERRILDDYRKES